MPEQEAGVSEQVLLIDDDQRLASMLTTWCKSRGVTLTVRHTASAGTSALRTGRYDLLLLDLMLPDADGLDVCRAVRQSHPHLPVLMLTARGDPTDRVIGLEVGADDYLPKPFSPKELEARIATILRRVGRGNAVLESRELPTGQGVLRLGDLVVDTNRRQVSRGSERINLTYTEFSLLELLFRDPGHVVPRAEILEQLWGYPPRRAADLRVVDVYVARLRGKLEPDPRNPELILTVRGIGYASQRMGEASAAG